MVIDTSAIMAILLLEEESEHFAEAIETAASRFISAVNVFEAAIVIESRLGEAGGRELDLLLYKGAFEIVATDADQAALARTAWRRYGKGRHPAALNLGDCFAYALSKATGEPLLFKGNDFSETDITPA